jgi:HEPN domain-containing protein
VPSERLEDAQLNLQRGRHAWPCQEATAAAAAAAGGSFAATGGEVAYDHTRSVFLGNLAYNVDEEDIIKLFHRSKEYPELNGAVEAVRVVRDRKIGPARYCPPRHKLPCNSSRNEGSKHIG